MRHGNQSKKVPICEGNARTHKAEIASMVVTTIVARGNEEFNKATLKKLRSWAIQGGFLYLDMATMMKRMKKGV